MLFFKALLRLVVPSRIFLVTAIIAFGVPTDADAKWKWKTIPADEAILNLKNWPTPTEQCRFRKGTPPNFERENTAVFCPRWVASDEPRTYFRLMELMPGYYWGRGFGRDFSEHAIFTKLRGDWFKYFKNPTIKPGQKTLCYADNDCSLRRIEFSVNGRECQ